MKIEVKWLILLPFSISVEISFGMKDKANAAATVTINIPIVMSHEAFHRSGKKFRDTWRDVEAFDPNVRRLICKSVVEPLKPAKTKQKTFHIQQKLKQMLRLQHTHAHMGVRSGARGAIVLP